jgi:catechol 2,3-dioxygenase-like lactoylglutathione lyase family enzyme
MSLIKLTPELVVSDVDKSVDFYVNVLGFQKVEGDSHFAKLRAGISEIMLFLKSDFDQMLSSLNRPENSGWSLLVIEIENIQDFYKNIKDKVKLHRPLQSTDYGTQEFTISDPDGYLIQFTQRSKL